MLYFFDSGTNNVKPTFADIDEKIANAHPVILNADGSQPNIFFTGTAKGILATSADVQLDELDPISGTGSESGLLAFSSWNALSTYRIGDFVRGSNLLYYTCIAATSQGNEPSATPADWAQIKFMGLWNTNQAYVQDDIVQGSDGYFYNSISGGSGTNPVTDTANSEWEPAVFVATSTRAGIIELATDAETNAGVATNRAVTPANLAQFGLNVPSGSIIDFAGVTIPSAYLDCDGSAVSRATYSTLFSAVTASKGTFTVTIAAPGVITLTGHGLLTGDVFSATTTDTLPTGLTASTNYYFIKNDGNTGWFATTYANAFAGTKVTTSGSQSGTHTLLHNPWGISGSSNFLLPDFGRRASIGSGGSGTATIGDVVGNVGGAETHTLTTAEMPAHTHGSDGFNSGSGSSAYFVQPADNGDPRTTTSTGGGGAHNNMQPAAVVNKIIKT